VLNDKSVHNISKASIRYYWNTLVKLDKLNNGNSHNNEIVLVNSPTDDRLRKQSVGIDFAQDKFNKAILNELNTYTQVYTQPMVTNNIEEVLLSSPDSESSATSPSNSKVLSKRNYKRTRSRLLKKPPRFNMSYTPLQEQIRDAKRIWRRQSDNDNTDSASA
jgi:hypothetical protein